MNSNTEYENFQRNVLDVRGFSNKYVKWLSLISVEPTMWLYMMAFMITSVIETEFFLYKTCRVNYGFSEEICRNLSTHKTEHKKVQSTMTTFLKYNDIATHAVPIVLAIFFSNWSDKRGRKLLLILGLLSKIIYSGMIIVNALMPTWDVNMIIYSATIPMSLLGGDIAIFASCFAYLSDITSFKQRTVRMTILEIVYLSTMPSGVALGSYLFKHVVNHSYAIMFSINVTLLILSLIYSLIILKWQSNESQQSLRGVNIFRDFFDKEHVKSMMATLLKSRPHLAQLHLWMLFFAMFLYTFQREEKGYTHMYTKITFGWDFEHISKFRIFQKGLFVISILIIAPVLTKLCGFKDTTLVCIGALSHASGRIFYATAETPTVYYAGAVVAAVGPIIASVLRSMVSKVVLSDERGKAFAILSICDIGAPLISSTAYSELYEISVSYIYWLTFTTQIILLLLTLIIHFTSKTSNDKDNEDRETTK